MSFYIRYRSRLKAAILLFCTAMCAYLLLIPLFFGEKSAPRPLAETLSGFNVFADDIMEAENVNMPYVVKNPDYEFVDFITAIPKSPFNVSALKFTVYLKNVWVYVDDELIYKNVFEPSWFNKDFPGSAGCIAVLPYESEGKQLRIRFERVIESDHAPILPFSITDGALNVKSSHSFSVLLLFMVSLAFVSIVLIFIALLYRKLKMNVQALLCLALTVLCISLWTLCNTKMFEIFTLNRALIHNLEYISFFILPLAFLCFIKRNWENPSRLLKITSNVMLGFYALSLILRIFFKIDFYSLLFIFHTLLVICVITVLYEIVIKYKQRTSSFKCFCFGATVFGLGAVLEIYLYYNNLSYDSIGSAFMLGLGVMSVILIMCYALTTKEQLDKEFERVSEFNMQAEHIRYEMLVSSSSVIFMDWQIENDTAYFSKQYEAFFGNPPVTERFWEIMSVHLAEGSFHFTREINEVYEAIQLGTQSECVEGWFIHKSGEKRWFEISVSAVFGPDSRPARVIGLIKDITREKQLLEEFKNRNEFIKVNSELFDNVLEADITENLVTGKNAQALADSLGIIGSTHYSDVINAISEQLTHEDFKEEYLEMLSRDRILSLYESNTPYFTYECIERSDGINYIWVRLTVCIYKSDITGTVRIISFVKNIDSEKKKELELLATSRTDALSGVLNKAFVKLSINEFLQAESGGAHAFLMLDADNFKAVNDTMGHLTGDKVIQELGKRLKELNEETDIVGRVGGDEFVVLVKNIKSREAMLERCEFILKRISPTVTHEGKTLTVTMSMGVCVYPECGDTYDTLYQNADKALYSAKNGGRNRFEVYGTDIKL